MNDHQHTGRCQCGAVRYGFGEALRGVINCHCSQCRRTHGHFAAYTNAKLDDFQLLEDRGLKWFRASDTARRGFCTECGATLFWDGDGNDYIGIAAGTLDAPTGLQTIGHIFVADKGDYYDIADGLPQHQQRL
ncbi:MAG TPA: GFA family protein [Rhodospirillales bacterium]|nr:GFA family protein [Rhodospirillales bacterium]